MLLVNLGQYLVCGKMGATTQQNLSDLQALVGGGDSVPAQ
jgi:hypothetical protein